MHWCINWEHIKDIAYGLSFFATCALLTVSLIFWTIVLGDGTEDIHWFFWLNCWEIPALLLLGLWYLIKFMFTCP